MRYLVRQKLFSFADRFNITDEMGVSRYEVEGKFLSIGKKLNIYGMDGTHLIYIEQEIFKFLPEYFLYKDGEVVARVKKEFAFLIPRVNIEGIYGDFKIDGSVMRYNFTIKKDGETVARITKEFLNFSDTYMVHILGEDEDFLLALVIVIDQIFHDNKKRSN